MTRIVLPFCLLALQNRRPESITDVEPLDKLLDMDSIEASECAREVVHVLQPTERFNMSSPKTLVTQETRRKMIEIIMCLHPHALLAHPSLTVSRQSIS
mmetsp:Transcript_21533/g.52754  ORF Transcript_21533/g.52754 Transcript_21533/m.52754 type:complete len:99 (-) Transcript_21533:23-319(-)